MKNGDSEQKDEIFTVLTVNDIYELVPIEGIGGLAQLSTILQRERKTAKNHITTINGDFMVATTLSNLTKGAHMIDIMNHLKVDYVVLGNHEFDYGPEETLNRLRESKFKWLGSNVFERDGKTLFQGVVNGDVWDVGSYRVGIFGLCTHEAELLSHPDGLVFAPIVETAQKAIEELKSRGAQVIIACTHQGIQDDRMLARRVRGIHLIIGGHDHSPFSEFEGETFIHKSGQNSEYLGRIDLSIFTTPQGLRVLPEYRMIPNRGFPADPEVRQVIEGYTSSMEAAKLDKMATVKTVLSSRTSTVRASESTMGNLVTDAVRQIFGTEVAIVQGGAIRGNNEYHPGDCITAFDINREFPFPNVLVLSRIKGKLLRASLEEGIRHLPNRAGSFPQVSGIQIHISTEKEPGERITQMNVGGKPLEDEKEYLIASTEFIRKGGDGYHSLRLGDKVEHPLNGVTLHKVISDYIREHKELSPQLEGRIIIS